MAKSDSGLESCTWDGGRRVGPLTVGEPLFESLRNSLSLLCVSSEVDGNDTRDQYRSTLWDVVAWNGVVSEVWANTTLIYNKRDLFQCTHDEFIEIFGEPTETDDIANGYVESLTWAKGVLSPYVGLDVGFGNGLCGSVTVFDPDVVPE